MLLTADNSTWAEIEKKCISIDLNRQFCDPVRMPVIMKSMEKMRSIICLMIFQLALDEWSNWEEMHIFFLYSSICIARRTQFRALHVERTFTNEWIDSNATNNNLDRDNLIYRFLFFLTFDADKKAQHGLTERKKPTRDFYLEAKGIN